MKRRPVDACFRRIKFARLLWFLILFWCGAVISSTTARAQAPPDREVVAIWVAPEAQVGDRMCWGEFQPTLHGQPGARVGVSYFLNPALAVSISGFFGGTSYRFVGPGVAGKLEDARWDARIGCEHYYQLSSNSRLFGSIAYDYGEARSWLNSAALREEGPRNYLVGVAIGAGAVVRLAHHVDLRSQLNLAALWGRATGVVTTNSYRWMGDELGVSVGLAYTL